MIIVFIFLFLRYSIRMKTLRELNIKNWSSYFFTEMTNINDIDPESSLVNDFKGCRDGLILFNIAYCEENSVPHIAFNNIEFTFRKRGIYSYLIFCENDKKKNMLNRYAEVIDEIKKEIFSFVDEHEEDYFVTGKDFTRFKFRTNDRLSYNHKINIPVCVISISSVIKKGDLYYPQVKLQKCFYESEN